MTDDNTQYEYSLSKHYTEPDIYFDEKKEAKREYKITDSKMIISMFISASGSNPTKLLALLSLFAGGTLREAATISGKSHEFVRLKLLEIKYTHPHLYSILKNNKQYIDSIMPNETIFKYTSFNELSKKYKHFNNLKKYCKKNRINYEYAKDAICHSKTQEVKIKNQVIKRNYKNGQRT